jgi:hypothetical protein
MESSFFESEVTLHSCIPVCIFLCQTVSETRLAAVKVQRVGSGWVAVYLLDAFAQLQKATFRFVTLVCACVRLGIHRKTT